MVCVTVRGERKRFRRSALVSTLTLENAMAAAPLAGMELEAVIHEERERLREELKSEVTWEGLTR